MRPTIVGPRSWPAHGPPPRFAVDTAGRSLYTVELATAPVLMISVAYRAPGNYFHGGDTRSAFATGCGWRIPLAAWTHLGRALVLYYRVVTFDQGSGRCDLSVDDHHLDTLPWLLVEDTLVEDTRVGDTRVGDPLVGAPHWTPSQPRRTETA